MCSLFFLSQKPKDRSKEIPPRDRCSAQARRDLHSEYRNLNGLTYINDCCRMCCSPWKRTCKCGEGRSARRRSILSIGILVLILIFTLQPLDEIRIGFRKQQRKRHFRGEHRPSNFAISRQSHNSLRRFVAPVSVGHLAKCT